MNMSQENQDKAHFIIIFLLVSFNLRMGFSAADPLLTAVLFHRKAASKPFKPRSTSS